MFPSFTVFGLEISMYYTMITIGLVTAIILFAKLCDRDKIPVKVSNFYLITAVVSIVVGFGFAVLFQAIYDWIETGIFNLAAGLTFMGGLIGGAVTFFAAFLIFKTPERAKYLRAVCCNALVAIAIAHCFGRIGCFFAGCCYGIQTDSFLGILFPGHSHKVFPTQLFEAIFLLALFIVLLRFKRHAVYIYPLAYGVFRFLIEFIRGDNRGQFVISSLSPSQTQSILMIMVGIGLLVYMLVKDSIARKNPIPEPCAAVAAATETADVCVGSCGESSDLDGTEISDGGISESDDAEDSSRKQD